MERVTHRLCIPRSWGAMGPACGQWAGQTFGFHQISPRMIYDWRWPALTLSLALPRFGQWTSSAMLFQALLPGVAVTLTLSGRPTRAQLFSFLGVVAHSNSIPRTFGRRRRKFECSRRGLRACLRTTLRMGNTSSTPKTIRRRDSISGHLRWTERSQRVRSCIRPRMNSKDNSPQACDGLPIPPIGRDRTRCISAGGMSLVAGSGK